MWEGRRSTPVSILRNKVKKNTLHSSVGREVDQLNLVQSTISHNGIIISVSAHGPGKKQKQGKSLVSKEEGRGHTQHSSMGMDQLILVQSIIITKVQIIDFTHCQCVLMVLIRSSKARVGLASRMGEGKGRSTLHSSGMVKVSRSTDPLPKGTLG